MKPWDASHFALERCKPFLHEGGDRGVLLLHGFTGSVAQLRPLGDALADLGYTVMGINLPGHAQTEVAMAQSDWKQWHRAAREAAIRLRGLCTVVTAVGLSMGGLLALLLASEGLVDGCVTLSAPMPVRSHMLWLAPAVAPFWPRVAKAPAAERHNQIDAAFDYGYAGYPTRKAGDLYRLLRLARREMRLIRCPLLVMQSDADHTVRASSADTILRLAKSAQKRKVELHGVHHVCTLSPALPLITEEIDGFVKSL